jgi:DNA-directed RNA polymerase specialized sigma subunit
MDGQQDNIYSVLVEIRDTLNRIFICFEDRYKEIQINKFNEMLEKDPRKTIFPLLFDKRRLSQTQIADLAHTSQSTVSRFLTELIDNNLIEQDEENGKAVYRDKYNLLKLIQK